MSTISTYKNTTKLGITGDTFVTGCDARTLF